MDQISEIKREDVLHHIPPYMTDDEDPESQDEEDSKRPRLRLGQSLRPLLRSSSASSHQAQPGGGLVRRPGPADPADACLWVPSLQREHATAASESSALLPAPLLPSFRLAPALPEGRRADPSCP